MSEQRDCPSLEARETGDHRGVLAEAPVSAQLNEFFAQAANIVERMGALRMARDLYVIPGL
jgi:hypothetical protein